MDLSLIRNFDDCLMRNTKLLKILSLESFKLGSFKKRKKERKATLHSAFKRKNELTKNNSCVYFMQISNVPGPLPSANSGRASSNF